MSKYFYDCEFLEGKQKKRVFGIPYGETPNTIDLISIGIVSEDDREYYAISKDFNLKEAWNRYDVKKVNDGRNEIKVYWIRQHVLRPIFYKLLGKDIEFHDIDKGFTYKFFKYLINKHGKTNAQIQSEILQFTLDGDGKGFDKWLGSSEEYFRALKRVEQPKIELYGYYSAYDHVLLSWIFGKMIDLPKSFPMFTIDLKQKLDEKVKKLEGKAIVHYLKEKTIYGFEPYESAVHTSIPAQKELDFSKMSFENKLKFTKEENMNYPKQTNEHDALSDARWNKELYKFIQSL